MKAKARSATLFSRPGASLGLSGGAFATRGASHDASGSGAAPSYSPAARISIGLVVIPLVLALFAATAFADGRIEGAGGSGIAVSTKEGGNIYTSSLSEFEPDGTLVGNFGSVGFGPGQIFYSDEVAVDNSCAQQKPPLTGATCEAFDPSYGDVYVVDQRSFRVEKFNPDGEFLLMFGGEVDKTTHADVCTAADVTSGDTCGAGVPGTGPSHFYNSPNTIFGENTKQGWGLDGSNSIAVGPDGKVYVGDFRRVQEFEPDGTYAGDLTLPEAQMVTSLAVDASGHVYANSPAVGEQQKIIPPASGTFTLTFKGQTTVPLAFDADQGTIQNALEALSTVGTGNVRLEYYEIFGGPVVYFEGALGDADMPQMTASAGSVVTLVEGAAGELVKLGPAGEILQTYDEGGEPSHIALDESGDVFLSDSNGGEFRFRAFRPDGSLYAEFSSDQADGALGLAVGDAANKLYALSGSPPPVHIAVIPLPESGPPTVTEAHVTDTQPTTSTLHAVVNPKGFDTEYHFEYVDQESFEHEGGFSSPHTHSTPSLDLGFINREDLVQAAVSGIATGTVYHFRAVAESVRGGGETVDGTEETFETLPAASIREFTTQTVGPELVTFKAELNPNGSATHYVIQLGKDTSYSTAEAGGDLSIGNEFVKLEAEGKEGVTFTGLAPNTEYHYRLVVENGYTEPGFPEETPDQTFTTEPSAAEERAAEECPNTNLREENNSLTLPDCRSYEQVSVVNKEGGQAAAPNLAPSGERVEYASTGDFAGAVQDEFFVPYIAHRSATGWETQAMLAKRIAPPGYQPIAFDTVSPELDRWIILQIPALSAEDAEFGAKSGYFSMGFADGSYLLHASPTVTLEEGELPRSWYYYLEVSAASTDLSHLFIVTSSRDLPLAMDPRPDQYGPFPVSDRIYEISGAGGPSPTMTLAAEVPLGLSSGEPYGHRTGCGINGAFGVNEESTRLISSDGTTLFYSDPVENVAGADCGEGTPNPIAIFARTGEAAPLQLNVPLAAQCHSPSLCASSEPLTASYDSASEDGSRVWFTTEQPLVDSDTDSTNDLYVAKLENGQPTELIQASAGDATPSHPTPGSGAEVNNVLGVSPDGTHAAFESPAVLTSHENALHQTAVQGAKNVYIYDTASRELKFVSESCPTCAGIGGSAPRSVLFTPDGRYLLFVSPEPLTPDKTSNTNAVFRYDFQTGQLIRLSFGRNGNDGNGNDNRFNAQIELSNRLGTHEAGEDAIRSISADGSTAIFATEAPLVSQDTNGRTDVYEWEEQGHGTCTQGENGSGGCVRLISGGVDPHGASSAVIDPSGRNIDFTTNANLVPTDTDGVPDVYDARIDGGFHASRPSPPCGSVEACHESAAGQPAAPPLGSETFVSPGNAQEHLECAKGRHRVKRHGQFRCVSNRRKHHHSQKNHHKKHTRAARHNRGGGK